MPAPPSPATVVGNAVGAGVLGTTDGDGVFVVVRAVKLGAAKELSIWLFVVVGARAFETVVTTLLLAAVAVESSGAIVEFAAVRVENEIDDDGALAGECVDCIGGPAVGRSLGLAVRSRAVVVVVTALEGECVGCVVGPAVGRSLGLAVRSRVAVVVVTASVDRSPVARAPLWSVTINASVIHSPLPRASGRPSIAPETPRLKLGKCYRAVNTNCSIDQMRMPSVGKLSFETVWRRLAAVWKRDINIAA